ncbi:MAG: molybdopterin-dependent oxidoreductase, partial [Desulfuromonadales bacterium]|nr:molybdopterin-dependent oxidoreductase [Desulfuromonadales bacterium]
DGDVDRVFSNGANKVIESFYTCQFVAHANMEPQNCTAWYHDDKVELWAPTQTPGRGRGIANVANVLGIDRGRVVVHQTRAGGGFGRRLINDPMCEAAAVSKRIGAPVRLQWSREDDMTHDFYRAGGFHAVKGAVDQAGRLIAFQDHLITMTHDDKEPVSGGNMSEDEPPAGLIENVELRQT